MHMELNSMKCIFFISHRMGRTKSRKTAHKCSSDSSDDGGAGLIPYRTAKTFTVFVKCFDCFLLRKTAKFVVDFHYVNVCFVKKFKCNGLWKSTAVVDNVISVSVNRLNFCCILGWQSYTIKIQNGNVILPVIHKSQFEIW